jgi:hypothetical protein
MASTLSWLDHDTNAAERSMRMLHLFKESEARDEFGIGGIRDAIADQLFPGTSTLHTRLRYVFFLPWLYAQLEEKQTSSSKYQEAGKQAEVNLLKILCESEPDATGIIGRNAGSAIKQLPSAVYWTALGSWGIRRGNDTRQQYFARANLRHPRGARRGRRDLNQDHYVDAVDAGAAIWHPDMIKLRPPEFPEACNLALTADEAGFLLDRWCASQKNSLLTWLALDAVRHPPVDQPAFIWQHPRLDQFPQRMQDLIVGGRKLNAALDGAALLYNLQLAELDKRTDLVTDYQARLAHWQTQQRDDCADWNLEAFWPLVVDTGHTITTDTRRFVEDWRNAAVKDIHSRAARQLIEQRESKLKGPKSRFTNRAALKLWTGEAGTSPLTYRWPVARALLLEWHAGWSAK